MTERKTLAPVMGQMTNKGFFVDEVDSNGMIMN